MSMVRIRKEKWLVPSGNRTGKRHLRNLFFLNPLKNAAASDISIFAYNLINYDGHYFKRVMVLFWTSLSKYLLRIPFDFRNSFPKYFFTVTKRELIHCARVVYGIETPLFWFFLVGPRSWLFRKSIFLSLMKEEGYTLSDKSSYVSTQRENIDALLCKNVRREKRKENLSKRNISVFNVFFRKTRRCWC